MIRQEVAEKCWTTLLRKFSTRVSLKRFTGGSKKLLRSIVKSTLYLEIEADLRGNPGNFPVEFPKELLRSIFSGLLRSS